jgi:uncharacterized membrane protein
MRALRHLFALPGAVSRAFADGSLADIEQAVRRSEQLHDGQIRVAVEAALDPLHLWRGKTARQRAIEVFAELGVWDTERNNGVLLYLLLAERNVEIVADRGFNGKVTAAEWEDVCRTWNRRSAKAAMARRSSPPSTRSQRSLRATFRLPLVGATSCRTGRPRSSDQHYAAL